MYFSAKECEKNTKKNGKRIKLLTITLKEWHTEYKFSLDDAMRWQEKTLYNSFVSEENGGSMDVLLLMFYTCFLRNGITFLNSRMFLLV